MMKKVPIVLLLLCVFVSNSLARRITMMLTSDPHVMSRELFDVPYGEAFLRGMQQDLKVIEDSQQLFDEFIIKVIDEHPDILLLPGDMSREGEKVSHEHVVSKLREVRESGIKVYVIPGNHDTENPCARIYRGNKAEKAESISDKEYLELYHECGYSESVMTDSTTNSYMVYPENDFALICLNTIIPNNYKSRYVHGRLSYELLGWIERAAKKAHEENRIVMVMMHHEIMEHHNQATYFIPTAMVNQEKGRKQPTLEEIRNTFRRLGISAVLTGHYHIQSIKVCDTPWGKITGITSGALSGFPSPYRYLTLDTGNKILEVKSANLFGTDTSRWPETEIAKKEFERLEYMVQDYIPRIPGKKTNMKEAYKYLAKPIGNVLCALAAGDEKTHDPKKAIDDCMKAFDDYVKHVTMYNVSKLNSLRTQKNGPYYRLRDLLTSIMYNYVGNPKNTTPDNDYTVKLE